MNPNSMPPLPKGLAQMAQQSGQKLFHVSLANKPPIEELLKDGMSAIEGQAFWVMADVIPRVGEHIRTQNGKLCEITLIAHSIVPLNLDGVTEVFTLLPWVAAVYKNS